MVRLLNFVDGFELELYLNQEAVEAQDDVRVHVAGVPRAVADAVLDRFDRGDAASLQLRQSAKARREVVDAPTDDAAAQQILEPGRILVVVFVHLLPCAIQPLDIPGSIPRCCRPLESLQEVEDLGLVPALQALHLRVEVAQVRLLLPQLVFTL